MHIGGWLIEDILGELSASITHLRIHSEALDREFDEL